MRHVSVEALFPVADADDIFTVLTRFEKYPELTPAVREVRVTATGEGLMDSEWSVNFRNGVLSWSERDIIDAVARTIVFTQLEGDFERFEGCWSVQEQSADGSVLVRLAATFELGMPTLDPIIGPIAERALIESVQLIITGLTGPETTFLVGSEAAPAAADS